MAGEPQVNYVGPPDFDEGGRCGFAVDLAAPRCEAAAVWHLFGRSAWGQVTLSTCEPHVRAAIAAMDELYGVHLFGDGCRARETNWLDDHCGPAVPSSKEPETDA
jgi:hypothetical protein